MSQKTIYRATQKFYYTDKKTEIFHKLYEICYESGKFYNEVLRVIIKCREGDFNNLEEFQELFKGPLDITNDEFFKEFLKIYRAKFGLKSNPAIVCRCCEDIIKKIFNNISGYYSKIERHEKRTKDGYVNIGNEPEFPKVQEDGFLFRCKFDRFKTIFKGDGYLHLRTEKGFRSELKIPFTQPINKGVPKFVEIVPHNNVFKVLIYTERKKEDYNLDENKYLSIDLGIDNFAAIVSSDGSVCELINGGQLASKIQYFGQKMAKVQSMYDKQGIKDGPLKQRILMDYENFVDNFVHKLSKYIVNLMIKNNIKYCIVGKNKGWKSKSKIGNNKASNRKFNRTFCKMPHAIFIKKLAYKIGDIGGKLCTINENYTSMCSSYDNEPIQCGDKNKGAQNNFKGSRGVRIGDEVFYEKSKKVNKSHRKEYHYDSVEFITRKGKVILYNKIKKNKKGEEYLTKVRGLFFTADNNQILNSDINGAFNILRKFFVAKNLDLSLLHFHKEFFNPVKKYIPI